MRSIAPAFLLFALLMGTAPAISHGQSTGAVSADVQAKLNMIADLTKKIQALQDQIKVFRGEQQQVVGQLVSSLKQGSQGEQVKVLQALLASDPDMYPEGLITGYYGSATKRAVGRFQTKHKIESVGNVGPKTLKKLNEVFAATPIAFEAEVGVATAGQAGSSVAPSHASSRPCVIIPPGHLIAPGWLRKHDGVRPIVPTCQKLPYGIEKKLGTTPTSTTPDTTAPVISSIGTSVTTSTATITWVTNEPATSQMMFGLTSVYGSSTALDMTLMTIHSQTMTGLAAGTVYHFQLQSKDAAGNLATSSDQIFTTATTAVADVTPPTISSISVNFGTSTATVAWTTNEPATSQVHYGANAAYGSSTTFDATLATSHSQNLMGLTPGVVYHFQVASRDAASNMATSSNLTFYTNTVDSTAPVISGVGASVGTSTATIAWTTNEAATSKVYYGTISPLGLTSTSTLSISDGTFIPSHSLNLSGLTASTTYYYVVESADNSMNLATSTEQSFTTSQ